MTEVKDVNSCFHKALEIACLRNLVKNAEAGAVTLDSFFELCLGFDPFYLMMPTRLASFFETIHTDNKLRDFCYELTEISVFMLNSMDKDVDDTSYSPGKTYARVVSDVAETIRVTKNSKQMGGKFFKHAISLDENMDVEVFLYNNPLLLTIYVLSMAIVETDIFNTHYIKK